MNDNVIQFPSKDDKIYNDLCLLEGETTLEDACTVLAKKYDVGIAYVANVWRKYHG